MTSSTKEPRIVDEPAAHAALTQLEKIERAIDRAMQPVADSLEVKDRKAVDRRIKWLKDDIKAYLEDNNIDDIHDGEFDVSGKLQRRNGTPTLDLISMVKANPLMLVGLAEMGCLEVDWKALERNFGKAAVVDDARAKYEMPGRGSNAFIYERNGGSR